MTNSKGKTTTMDAFSCFDVVSDESDHHFRSPFPEGCFSNSKSPVYKHVMKEWKILKQNLPESIYVRVYENRIDLMRAVIIGAAGTPYHDGLFFFDIALPSNYPTQPPKVHFHSFGLRLNPNLYDMGTVCLSLLNTWHGNTNEKWNPHGSTLLQVLLSIQGLVLNEKPYFNEPGHAFGRSVFENKSRAYNEQVFALTWQVSIKLICKPPKNFEALVKTHFRERAVAILTACGEYVNGRVRVGYYCSHNKKNESNVKVSVTFEGMMVELYPKLVKMFQSCGAVLGASLEKLKLEGKRPKRELVNDPKNKNNVGIFKKAVAKIKEVLGWKNSGKKKIN